MAELNEGRAFAEWSVDDSGATVVLLRGELDIASVEPIRAEVEKALSQAGNDSVTFDLSKLDFMDSSGLALLVGASKRVGFVLIRQPSATIRRVIEVTGLDAVLRVDG